MRQERARLLCAVTGILVLPFSGWFQAATGLDGNNTLELSTFNGWDAFELVTEGDDITAINDTGYGTSADRRIYDGLGGYLSGGTLSVFINHETGTAAVSRLDLDLADFRQAIDSVIDGGATAFPSTIATGMGYAYDKIYDGSYHAVNAPNPVATGAVAVGNYGDTHFDRFCSGTSYLAQSFGPGRGFVDQMYMTGEEVGGGKFYALDSATQTFWEVPDVGTDPWENAALVDTGNTTHVGVILMSDVGGSPGDYIQMYVGKKGVDANSDGEIDFLERNGLRGGTVYFFDPDGAASTSDLPDGQVTGKWSTSTAGALQETKLEDIHTNPADGTQAVFADQTDGVYTMDLNLQFTGDMLDTAASTVTINQIDDDDTGVIGAPDNLTWSADGQIYVQEDGSGNDIWHMNDDGTGITQLAHALSEPSGIFDVSGLAGYAPGSVFLTSMQGTGSRPAQLSALISPGAAAIPEPASAWVWSLGGLQVLLLRRRRGRRRARLCKSPAPATT